MHYYLALEVWKRSDEIFFSQGKYALEIWRIRDDGLQVHGHTHDIKFEEVEWGNFKIKFGGPYDV